jgi:D-alanyl-D-alanine carboxypeptidase (penicillin-binding protein 5/6)
MVSANDAAVALAEQSGGTLDGFSAQMQATARSLGMIDSPRLEDPSGLDDSFAHGGGDWISAWDLALAGRAGLADPTIAAVTGTTLLHFDDPSGNHHRLTNHNKLLSRYPGATGLKTGMTHAAGNTLIATATKDGRTMLVVVLDAPQMYDATIALLDKGFATGVSAETGPRLPALRRVARAPSEPASKAGIGALPAGTVRPLSTSHWPAEVAIGVVGATVVAVAARRRQVLRRRRMRRMRHISTRS